MSNFNFSFSSSFSTRDKKKSKKRLTPQDEYWLDRILRDHSKQIFVIFTLFFISIIAAVIVAALNGTSTITINP